VAEAVNQCELLDECFAVKSTCCDLVEEEMRPTFWSCSVLPVKRKTDENDAMRATIVSARKASLNFVHPANGPRNGPAMPRDKSRKAVLVYAAANAGMFFTTSINLPEFIS
jgi:hypothetical protein